MTTRSLGFASYYICHSSTELYTLSTAASLYEIYSGDESQVANIARGKAECYIFHKTFTKSCILLYKRSSNVFKCFIAFYTY